MLVGYEKIFDYRAIYYKLEAIFISLAAYTCQPIIQKVHNWFIAPIITLISPILILFPYGTHYSLWPIVLVKVKDLVLWLPHTLVLPIISITYTLIVSFDLLTRVT